MTTRTIWEVGRDQGRSVVALGVALTLSAIALDLLLVGEVGWFLDLTFVAVAITMALRVHPRDFFTVGVAPPLILIGAFVLLAVSRPGAVGHVEDNVVQATISGLATHYLPLVLGYAGCLGCLAVRQRFAQRRDAERGLSPRSAPGRLHPDG